MADHSAEFAVEEEHPEPRQPGMICFAHNLLHPSHLNDSWVEVC